MTKLLFTLEGKKTYIIAGITVLYAILGVYLKLVPLDDAITLVLGALGLSALRSGVAKRSR